MANISENIMNSRSKVDLRRLSFFNLQHVIKQILLLDTF